MGVINILKLFFIIIILVVLGYNTRNALRKLSVRERKELVILLKRGWGLTLLGLILSIIAFSLQMLILTHIGVILVLIGLFIEGITRLKRNKLYSLNIFIIIFISMIAYYFIYKLL